MDLGEGHRVYVLFTFQSVQFLEFLTGAHGIPVGYGFLVAVYVALGAVAAVMLRRIARRPIEIAGAEAGS